MDLSEFRSRQDAIIRALIAALARLLRLQSGRPMTETQKADLAAVISELVEQSRGQSIPLAAELYEAMRPEGSPSMGPPQVRPIPVEYWAKVVDDYGDDLADPELNNGATAKVAGVASRQVEDAARQVTMRQVAADPVAEGFARFDPKPPSCAFCATLISRGAEYKADSFDASNRKFSGSGLSKAHDNCSCTLVPVFNGTWQGIEQYEHYTKLWADHVNQSGKQAIKQFADIIKQAEAAPNILRAA